MSIIAIFKLFTPQIWVLVVIYFGVFFCVALDLWSGVRKAKKKGKFSGSFGLRRTVEKALRYFNLLLALTVFDTIQMLAIAHVCSQTGKGWPVIPVLTILGALFLCATEIVSIYESAEKKEKARMKDTAVLIAEVAKLIKDENTAEKVAELLKKKEDETL